MASNPKLSVIIPAYNETENFNRGVLDKVNRYLTKKKYSSQVIIVDDGSTDDSIQSIKAYIKDKANWRLITNPHQGKAQTVATGIAAATGKYILFTDFDQATPLSEVEKLFPFIKKGYHVAIGSREVKGAKRLKEPWYRHLMGRGFNFFVSLIALRGIHDTQCGFKMFTHKAAKDLFSSLVVYGPHQETAAFTGAFDVEILYLAQKKHYRIAEVPVAWKHVKTNRVSPVRDSVRMFLDLLRIRLADLMGKYK